MANLIYKEKQIKIPPLIKSNNNIVADEFLFASRKISVLSFSNNFESFFEPITPFRNLSYLELTYEKIFAFSKKYSYFPNWFISVEKENFEDMLNYFEYKNYYNINPQNIILLLRRKNPISDLFDYIKNINYSLSDNILFLLPFKNPLINFPNLFMLSAFLNNKSDICLGAYGVDKTKHNMETILSVDTFLDFDIDFEDIDLITYLNFAKNPISFKIDKYDSGTGYKDKKSMINAFKLKYRYWNMLKCFNLNLEISPMYSSNISEFLKKNNEYILY